MILLFSQKLKYYFSQEKYTETRYLQHYQLCYQQHYQQHSPKKYDIMNQYVIILNVSLAS